MEKMKIVKNSLSVTYDNGKIVKYRQVIREDTQKISGLFCGRTTKRGGGAGLGNPLNH